VRFTFFAVQVCSVVIKVVRTVTNIVNHLPPDVFEESVPLPPPAAFSPHYSFHPMGPHIPAIPTPANSPDAERNNIIRELVETERKYVQVLEVMKVRTSRSFLLFAV
jgi:cell division control protein 24